MSADVKPRLPHDATVTTRWSDRLRRHWKLTTICAVFMALRLPVAYRQLPAQDEDYFAVPGLTILREGVPRIPYMPSRNPEGAFYKADELLFTLPPLYFYWQALVYWCIGPGTAAARVASMLCGVAAIVAVHRLALLWFRDEGAALWSAGLYAASRVVYFPVMTARPDMLCGALGLGALLAIGQWSRTQRQTWLQAAGFAIGAAALTHPFAIVPAIQVAAWTFFATQGWTNRVRNVGTLTTIASLVFLLWLPLIVLQPEAFQAQFFNAVLNQSGPGLMSRMFMPLRSLQAQAPIFLEHVGGLQAALMLGGTAAATALCIRRSDPDLRSAVVLAWSAVYLHVVFIGSHPTKGYWCYTGALLFLCAGNAIAIALQGIRGTVLARSLVPSPRPSPPSGAERQFQPEHGGEGQMTTRCPHWSTIAAVAIAAVVMLPGAGLRTLVAHVRHWNDINYDAPRFTQQLIAGVPADARLVVDSGYIFEFYRAGRDVTLALDYPFFFSVRGTEYDFVVGGPDSISDRVPELLNARFVRAMGDKDDPFACYAEIYQSPTPKEEEPRK